MEISFEVEDVCGGCEGKEEGEEGEACSCRKGFVAWQPGNQDGKQEQRRAESSLEQFSPEVAEHGRGNGTLQDPLGHRIGLTLPPTEAAVYAGHTERPED